MQKIGILLPRSTYYQTISFDIFQGLQSGLENLEKKLFRAEKRKHEVSLKQIENVKSRLFPTGVLQERVLNIAPMYVNYGEDFLSSLIENLEPLGGDFTVLLP